jgi:DNA recombination protein RmuC
LAGETTVDVLSIFMLVVALFIALVIFSLFRKPPQLPGLNEVSEALTNVRIELKGLSEKVQSVGQNQNQANQGISSLATGLARADTEIKAMSERVEKVERAQNQANQGISSLGTGLAKASELTRSIAEAAEAVKTQLSSTKSDIASLQTLVRAKQEVEQETSDVVRRLETIIAGTQTKGAAGENILDHVFSKLPIAWQVRNFRVGDKHVEFGLRLPNNLVLPIDSKWMATNLLEQFASCKDIQEQQRLKNEISKAVLNKAREVRKYLEPNLTMTFGVAAVPDAVYDLCAECHAEAFEMNVVIISYSMFVPYLLLVFHTVLKTGASIDLQRLEGFLHSVQESAKSLQEELEGRLSRAITMLSNSRDEMRAQLGKAVTGLTSIQINTDYVQEGGGRVEVAHPSSA